jgi:hypothetical protein
MYVRLILRFFYFNVPFSRCLHICYVFFRVIVFPYIFLPQIAILCGEIEKYYGLSYLVV